MILVAGFVKGSGRMYCATTFVVKQDELLDLAELEILYAGQMILDMDRSANMIEKFIGEQFCSSLPGS